MITSSDPADYPLTAVAKAWKVISYISNCSSEEGDELEYCKSKDGLTMVFKEEGIDSLQNTEIEVGDYVLVALQKSQWWHTLLLIDSLDVAVKFWKHLSNVKFIPTDEVSLMCLLCLPKPVHVSGTSRQSGKFAIGKNLASFSLK